jgi:hypothetical protein
MVQQFAENLGNVLDKFIIDLAKEETDQSQNYIYILFETTALTVKYMKSNGQLMGALEAKLSNSLNYIIQNDKSEFIGFAFQIYSLFVAGSLERSELYDALFLSCIQNKNNWNKDMKHLAPSLGQFMISMICKYPEYVSPHSAAIGTIIMHLLSSEIR